MNGWEGKAGQGAVALMNTEALGHLMRLKQRNDGNEFLRNMRGSKFGPGPGIFPVH